jgi:outer membrane protein TolC
MARIRADSAVAEVRIARAYPNPQLQSSHGLPSQYSVTIPVDIGPQRHYRVSSQRQGVSAVAHDTSDIRRQLLFAVRQAYCDAQLSTALNEIALEEREIVRQLLAGDIDPVVPRTPARRDSGCPSRVGWRRVREAV